MRGIYQDLATLFLVIFLVGTPGNLLAASTSGVGDTQGVRDTRGTGGLDQNDCWEIAALLQKQNNKLSGDLRHIRREIAALRADLDKPSFKDILAGIGYILGLFGAAAWAASRRKG